MCTRENCRFVRNFFRPLFASYEEEKLVQVLFSGFQRFFNKVLDAQPFLLTYFVSCTSSNYSPSFTSLHILYLLLAPNVRTQPTICICESSSAPFKAFTVDKFIVPEVSV